MKEMAINVEDFMRRAIQLAKLGEGWTNPNPLVGAVIVRDGKIIGEGFHHKWGELHAERDAIQDMKNRGESGNGAEMFVTLEPCCHFGKQPPCTHSIVAEGIKKVFVGSRDPNPLVHGKGNAYLLENGVQIVEDFLKDECDEINEIFFKFIREKKPFVALKYAMTIDGKIATKTGKSKWITGEESRKIVHNLRNRYSVILAGIGTVLADDPLLNCRMNIEENLDLASQNDLPKSSVQIYGKANPVRVICDSNLCIPLESQIVRSAKEIKTIIAASRNKISESEDLKNKVHYLESYGVEVLLFSETCCGVDLNELLAELAKRNFDSVLVEGGGQLNYSFLEQNLVNKIYVFVSPKIFGGDGALGPVRGKGIDDVQEAYDFSVQNICRVGNDILIEMKK